MVFGWFRSPVDRPRRLKLHDVEVNFAIAGSDMSAKLDQNIYSDGGGLFQLRVRHWPRDVSDAPLQLWIDDRLAAQWPMSGRDFKLRIDDPYAGGMPKIEIGTTLELRKGGHVATGTAEAD